MIKKVWLTVAALLVLAVVQDARARPLPPFVYAGFDAAPTIGGAPLTVTFTNTSGANIYTITNCLWDFGDNATTNTATVTNVNHTYLSYSTNTVWLTVSADVADIPNSSTNYSTNQVILVVPYLIGFSATPTNGGAPLTVAFTNNSVSFTAGTITNCFWSFGDGATTNTATVTNLLHTYLFPGTNTVGLTVSMTSVSDSAFRGIGATSVDSVGDGIPDWWRALYFGGDGKTTNSQSCVTGDPDHDGMNNWQEYIAGTDPMNRNSFLGIMAITNFPPLVGTGLVVQWSSVTGKFYRLDRSTNLLVKPPFDSNVGTNIFATPPLNTATDTTAAGQGPYFYRIGVQ